MPITQQTLNVAQQQRNTAGNEADQTTRDLAKQSSDEWADIAALMLAAALAAALLAQALKRWPSPLELLRLPQAARAFTAAQAALRRLRDATVSSVTSGAMAAIDTALDLQPRLIASQFPPALYDTIKTRVAGNVSPSAVDVMRERCKQQITSTVWPLSDVATEAMKRELMRGASLSLTPEAAAQAMVDATHGQFQGGLSRAIVIARTEILDALREAARHVDMANADVVQGWTWRATLDSKTCISCIVMDGTEWGPEVPGPLDHQQGRCSRVTTIRPWAELGISGDEPEDQWRNARDWFTGLPESEQVRIVGAQKLALLASGRIQWADLATRREMPGWRPSYVPTSLRELQARTTPLVV